MLPSAQQLRQDAMAIWQAGLEAVRSQRLVAEHVRLEGSQLWIGDDAFELDEVRRIVVVGGGKASAGMAEAVEQVLDDELLAEKDVTGWVNVPEDCLLPLKCIYLHAARPAGINEPTEEGVLGTETILELVESCGPRDLCLCLLSGGGSALLAAPADAISLADKQQITRHLTAAGANIRQLNTVRKHLSRIKGGGLARACRAGRLVSLIISDVLGDPLDVIASGPTVTDSTTPAEALAILDELLPEPSAVPEHVRDYLRNKPSQQNAPPCPATNLVIGNNATAVDAAGSEAVRLGYRPAMIAATELEGPAEQVGEHLAEMAMRMRNQQGPDCLISGGEPTVRLVAPERRGKGGRNQQLVLAAARRLVDANGIVILSGGTDGEDGPTDAAGAVVGEDVLRMAREAGLDMDDHLARNDAYHFFEPTGGLIKTGPTHTNVCDVRVVLVGR
ncbi:MAG: DUF4147 domain-containing protein [Pirellulales bacterium]